MYRATNTGTSQGGRLGRFHYLKLSSKVITFGKFLSRYAILWDDSVLCTEFMAFWKSEITHPSTGKGLENASCITPVI